MEHLLPRFVDAARSARATAPAAEVEGAGMDLLRRWSEPHRGYHDVRHLGEVLARLDELSSDGVGVGAASHLAAWFHDAVYTGAPGDDERASAELARSELRALGVSGRTADRVRDLVAFTADHEPPGGDEEAAALCDADLAVLASPLLRYRDYVTGVRTEYTHLSDTEFAAGRAAVLRRLLERDALFATAPARDRWEGAARANLTRELAELTTP